MRYPENDMAETQETLNPKQEITILRQKIAELEAENGQLQQLARIDHLTGLGNKKYFDEELDIAIESATREKRPLSLIVVDLDDFKKVNDEEGHLPANEVLKNIAKVILSGVRKTDRTCRFGGEEIAIILPNTPANRVVGVAERLRHAVETSSVDVEGRKITVTASFGVGSFNPNLTEKPLNIFNYLVDTADKSMYYAKRAGKNRVGFTDKNGKPRVLEQSNSTPLGKVAVFPNS